MGELAVWVDKDLLSLPVRGAWVEIPSLQGCFPWALQSLPVRGAWVEICGLGWGLRPLPSLPVRGAWVEIYMGIADSEISAVAPRAGSVG